MKPQIAQMTQIIKEPRISRISRIIKEPQIAQMTQIMKDLKRLILITQIATRSKNLRNLLNLWLNNLSAQLKSEKSVKSVVE